MAAFLSLNIYIDWQSNQIITSVGTTGYSIENIEFPSVTICAQGSIQRVTGNFTVPLTFENYKVECLKTSLLRQMLQSTSNSSDTWTPEKQILITQSRKGKHQQTQRICKNYS